MKFCPKHKDHEASWNARQIHPSWEILHDHGPWGFGICPASSSVKDLSMCIFTWVVIGLLRMMSENSTTGGSFSALLILRCKKNNLIFSRFPLTDQSVRSLQTEPIWTDLQSTLGVTMFWCADWNLERRRIGCYGLYSQGRNPFGTFSCFWRGEGHLEFQRSVFQREKKRSRKDSLKSRLNSALVIIKMGIVS